MKKIGILFISMVLSVLLCQSCSSAEDIKIIPSGKFQALGGYSDSDKSSGVGGYNFSWAYAPSVKLNDTQYLIPLYSGNLERMLQYVVQEEGGQFYRDWQLHNISMGLRSQHTDEWSSRATGIATWNFLKETQDEGFGTGLYDYRDFGATFDLKRNIRISEDREHDYSYGIGYFRRTYPNYHSLISLASATAPENDEKDYDGVKFSAGFKDLYKRGLSWEARPSVFLKFFTSKKEVGSDGVLTEGKRRDYVLGLDLNGDLPVKEGAWVISADNNVTYNHSNLDFYDSRGTLILNDDVFTQDYYTFFSVSTYPYITYYHPLGKGKQLALSGGYSFLYRHYPGRKVQEANGAYTGSNEHDFEHALHLSSSYPITKELSWVSYFDYSWVRSNQKYEQYYHYNYNIYRLQSGLSVEF